MWRLCWVWLSYFSYVVSRYRVLMLIWTDPDGYWIEVIQNEFYKEGSKY